ncbi:MAG TPA: hypothetical protein VIN00_09705 [Candidatus Dormibacteraeota bacterium]|jgi:hypothetical protein
MRRAVSTFAAIGVVLVMAIPAQASGAGAVSMTQNIHNGTSTFDVTNPCTGVAGTVTENFNAVFHLTVLTSGVGAGTGWGTFTLAGDFTLVQVNGVTYTGHITIWDGQNFNLTNYTATSTFILHGKGSDGTSLSFHEVVHITAQLGPPPTIVVFFDKPTCG